MNARRFEVTARAFRRGIVPPAHRRGIVPPAHRRGIVPPAHQRGIVPPAHQRGIVPPAHQRGIVPPAHQRGIVLFVALIAMVVLGLSAAALIRSSDTSAVIAGNLAFKDGATHAADTGVERAFTALPALAAADVDVPNRYFRLIQPVDASGVPTSIVWANVPCYDVAGGATPISCADGSSYRVQYVIERLCEQAPTPAEPVTTLTGKCVAGQPFSVSGNVGNDRDSHTPSGNYGVPPVTGALPPTIHYRVTVRVQGPRNTASLVQATIELPYI